MTPLDNTIRRELNGFEAWNNQFGVIDPISGDYFEMLQLIKMATIRGYNTKIKDVDNKTSAYELAEWYLYSCAPHGDLDALEEWYSKWV